MGLKAGGNSVPESKKCILEKTVILFSLIVWILTEGLSIFHMLTSQNMRIIWGVLVMLTGVGVTYNLKRCKQLYSVRTLRFKINQTLLKDRWFELLLLIGCFSISVITFILALTIVPNNWDSMTYHLARVANWIENATVEYYPTNIPRQIYYSAFMEYFILHICLVLKNDLFVNLVQWCSYILSAITVYKIAIDLNIDRISALFSALLFMLCPLALAESMTTQIDLFACMWILIFAYFVLELGKSDMPLGNKENMTNLFFCACSIGFCYLTKSSVCFIIPPFLLWYLIICIKKKERIRSVFSAILFAGGVIALLMTPSAVRNFKSTGNIFAYQQIAGNLMMKTIDPKLLTLNLCKNVTMEMAEDNWPNPIWNMTMNLADKFEIDIEEPQISAYSGFSEGTSCKKSYHQDSAGAQILFSLMWVALGLILLKAFGIFKKTEKKDYCIKTYLWAVIGAVGIMLIFIRWQPWGNRLLLPVLPFICIFTMWVLDECIQRDFMKKLLICVILLSAFPDAYNTLNMQIVEYAKPAWEGQSRFSLYFRNRGSCLKGYEALIEKVMQTKDVDIGLLLSGDTYEYPLWVGLKNKNTALHHIVFENSEITWYPQCIAAIDRNIKEGEQIEYGKHRYKCVWNYEGDSNYAVLIDM